MAGSKKPASRRPRGTGATRQLPSGRWQARFRGPDGVMRPAPVTFNTKLDADMWLKGQTSDVDRGMWAPPDHTAGGPVPTLKDYADNWLMTRTLKPRSRQKYRSLLDTHILPTLGQARIDRITPVTVRNWHSQLDGRHAAARAHAYSLLRVIMQTAWREDAIKANPCRLSGAGQNPPRQHEVRGVNPDELARLIQAMPERFAAMVMLAAWCALRLGELLELRRKDVALNEGVVRVRRSVQYMGGGTFHVDTPKSDAGIRDVAIPPHLLPMLQAHLDEFTDPAAEALLWGSTDPAAADEHLAPQSFRKGAWNRARKVIDRPDLRFHDLRHTGATLAAMSGATVRELMGRLGHTTPAVAMKYQIAAQARDQIIAARMSEMAAADNVVPLRKVGS